MEPVLVRINRRRCILLGTVQAAMALILLSMLALPLSLGIFDWLIAAGLLTAAFFGWYALHFFGLAAKNPAALRMDAQGISGYYADPATWDEISAVKAITGGKGHRFLGFVLADPVAFRDRQSVWRRFRLWSNWNGNGVHIVVPQMVLAEADIDELAQKAQRFFEAARR